MNKPILIPYVKVKGWALYHLYSLLFYGKVCRNGLIKAKNKTADIVSTVLS